MPQSATAACPNCRAEHRVEVQRDEQGSYLEFTVPCQGAKPDLCSKRLCVSCVTICGGCSLPCCEEHTVDIAGERFCFQCVALMEGDGLEICSQETAETVCLLAAAGCSIAETRAALAIRGRMVS